MVKITFNLLINIRRNKLLNNKQKTCNIIALKIETLYLFKIKIQSDFKTRIETNGYISQYQLNVIAEVYTVYNKVKET